MTHLMTASTGTATVPTLGRESAEGTGHSISGSLNMLAIVLALAGVPTHLPTHSRTSGANMSVTIREWDFAGAILTAISDLHDQLLAKARALPAEAARVLYANLWDLYLD